jgi:hypothetical protein
MVKSRDKSIRVLRTEAVEYALLVNRFLEPKIFPKVMEAIRKDNEKGVEDFKKICIALDIPKEQIPTCIATAFAYSPTYYDLNPVPGTKTSRPQSTGQLW